MFRKNPFVIVKQNTGECVREHFFFSVWISFCPVERTMTRRFQTLPNLITALQEAEIMPWTICHLRSQAEVLLCFFFSFILFIFVIWSYDNDISCVFNWKHTELIYSKQEMSCKEKQHDLYVTWREFGGFGKSLFGVFLFLCTFLVVLSYWRNYWSLLHLNTAPGLLLGCVQCIYNVSCTGVSLPLWHRAPRLESFPSMLSHVDV